MQSSTVRSIRDTVLLILAAVFLFVAQSAFWLNHTIFDKQTFTSIVTPVVNSTETRSAIASTVVDRAFEDRPLVNRLIGNNVTALITGLLGTDVAVQMITALIDRSYEYLTTGDREPVVLDLVAIKEPLQKITELLESRGRDVRIDPTTIPDTVILLNPSDVPDFYQFSVLLLWLGPLCWIGLLIVISLYLYLGRSLYDRRIYILGSVIIVVSLLGMLAGPLLPPPISAQINIPELRGTVNELISALLAPFIRQMSITIVLTLIVMIVVRFRFNILHGGQWAMQKTVDSVSTAKSSSTKPAKKK